MIKTSELKVMQSREVDPTSMRGIVRHDIDLPHYVSETLVAEREMGEAVFDSQSFLDDLERRAVEELEHKLYGKVKDNLYKIQDVIRRDVVEVAPVSIRHRLDDILRELFDEAIKESSFKWDGAPRRSGALSF